MADNNDDYKVRNYQDELDNNADEHDKVTEELTDDPTKELGVPANELAAEEAHYAFEDGRNEDDDETEDDRREEFEDELDDGSNQDK